MPFAPKAPCLIFANGIGDHFITLPSIRALCSLFVGKITLITSENSPFTKYILSGCNFKEIVEVRVWDDDLGNRRIELDSLDDKYKFDLLINMTAWDSDDIHKYIYHSKVKESIGLFPSYTYFVKPSKSIHYNKLIFRIPLYFDKDPKRSDFTYPPRFKLGNKDLVREIQRRLPKHSRKRLVIHNETKSERMWSHQRLRALVKIIAAKHRDIDICIVGIHQIDLLDQSHNVIQINNLHLLYACSFVLSADYYIGVDSSFTHLVSLSKIPAVALYGPTKSRNVGLHQKSNQFNLQGKKALINSIKPSQVYEAFKKLLPKRLH